jgi:pimeloyl-ACP methyl ester carboxylesterase
MEGYRKPIRDNQVFRHAQRIVQTWTADLADLEKVLPQIRDYPTLLMWGTRDRAVSFSSAERLRQNFRETRLVAFKDVGHLPYEEAPEEFNNELIKFLTSAA